MTFKVLIIEDNHSFIDSLKVMLRDLPLDFSHAFRYTDAQGILEKTGVFYNRPETDPAGIAAQGAEAVLQVQSGKRKGTSQQPKLFNEGGVFLIIVEQNTETSMKGTDFVGHAVRKFPGLSEADFILLTHRLELVPARNYPFPVLEKPLRAPQIRQAVMAKLKQAQDLIDMQIRLEAQKEEDPQPAAASPRKKGFRDLLKINRKGAEGGEVETAEKKPAKKQRKTVAPKKSKTKAVKAKGK